MKIIKVIILAAYSISFLGLALSVFNMDRELVGFITAACCLSAMMAPLIIVAYLKDTFFSRQEEIDLLRESLEKERKRYEEARLKLVKYVLDGEKTETDKGKG